MISVDQALKQLLAQVAPVCGIETVAVDRACGRVLAKPLVSPLNVPPADNSSMDGYAVYSQAIKANTAYPVSQRITAGPAVSKRHTPGTAARIFTGAEIPDGADAVIIQENSQPVDGDKIAFTCTASAGDNIRRKGQDVARGCEILAAGTRLRPQEAGLIASCGIEEVAVYKPLKLALVSSGDELVNPGTELLPGQIYNSNRFLLGACCQQAGFELIDLGTAKDNFAATKALLLKAAAQADLVITTGGVSVGEEDHVKAAVEDSGQLKLWKVAIKPGKPLAFGKIGNTDFIGLPGNPCSVFTTFLVLALPRLKRMQGLQQEPQQSLEHHPALFSRPAGSRREYLRARRTKAGIEIFPNQSSGVLSSACWGDGFAVCREQSGIEPGQPIEFVPYLTLY